MLLKLASDALGTKQSEDRHKDLMATYRVCYETAVDQSSPADYQTLRIMPKTITDTCLRALFGVTSKNVINFNKAITYPKLQHIVALAARLVRKQEHNTLTESIAKEAHRLALLSEQDDLHSLTHLDSASQFHDSLKRKIQHQTDRKLQ